MQDTEQLTISQKAAKFIKEKRLARGETQRQFAVSVFGDVKKQGWIAKIELGRGITLETLHSILTAINCDIEFIEH